jgi:sirohydrochlorin cobaltochelatase
MYNSSTEKIWSEIMLKEKNKAILVVSFGTSFPDTCRKTIEKIEEEIRQTYPEYAIYRAWTSGMIRRKLLKRDGIQIPGVKEALEQMQADGIEEVIVQPTHVINGIENDEMKKNVEQYKHVFRKVLVGTPLLTSQKDQEEVLEAVLEEMKPSQEELLIFMGHGTEHYSNSVYAALNYQLKDMGHENVLIATVEAYPSIEQVVREADKKHDKKIRLAPFMLVAGDHANNDLAGEKEDSWKNILEREGHQVTCELKGLGEYPGIRAIYMEHLETAIHS